MLKSKFFADNLRLAETAVSHPAHVVPGACGPHVAKIQYALIALDRAQINVNEIANMVYGPSTTAAVLAFKTKRRIVNYAYQSRPDNIVGKMTIAALDAEMASLASSPAPIMNPGAFFVTADALPGQTFSKVLGSFGLDTFGQLQAIRDPHNDPLHGGAARMMPDWFVNALMKMPLVQRASVVVPINIKLTVTEFRAVIDMNNGLRPRPMGALGPPVLTHGVEINVARNLGPGSSLRWIQTVRKLNNPDKNAPREFVDGSGNNLPYSFQPPPGLPLPVEFNDVPCGPIAPHPAGGVDFTAMTTLAVLARGHIILAAAKVWGFVIGTSRTLPDGVRATAPKDAADADFRNQLRILRAGINATHQPTGPNLDYIIRPAPGTVVR